MAGAENVGCAAHARPTVCPSVASRNPLLYQSLPIIIPFRYALLRRRKDDTGVGTAARGIVERLRRFPRCVRPHGGRATRLRGALSDFAVGRCRRGCLASLSNHACVPAAGPPGGGGGVSERGSFSLEHRWPAAGERP